MADLSEISLVGIALSNPEITITTPVDPTDFDDMALGAAWEAIGSLHGEGKRPDPAMIIQRAKPARIDPSVLVDCVGSGVGVNADYYADQIRSAARRRRFEDLLVGARQRLADGMEIEAILSVLEQASDATVVDKISAQVETLDEFVDAPLPTEQWVVPDLLTVDDRVIVTGVEGGGKSTLFRQVAGMTAAGVHPFTYERVPPRRVLYVDCENSRRTMQTKFGPIRDALRDRGTPAGSLMITRRPGGMDVRHMSDRLWLHQLCRTLQPELLIIGPIYRMCSKGPGDSDETVASNVITTIDRLRAEFPMALMMEHHPKHADSGRQREMRPFGSSMWMRWPEFGIGLSPSSDSSFRRRVVDVVHWRGARDERPWPRQLESGGIFPWIDPDPAKYAQRRAAA